MRKLFFHNQHDTGSREILNALQENTQIINVFGGDRIPEGYHISKLPYLIDKQLKLLTPGPFELGIFTLRWRCENEEGEFLNNNPNLFITVNDIMQNDKPENGILEIEIECNIPTTLWIEITNESDGYHPWRGTVNVREAVENA